MDRFSLPATKLHPQLNAIICSKCDGLIYACDEFVESYEEPDFDYDEDGGRELSPSDGWSYRHEVCPPDDRIIPDDLEFEDDQDDAENLEGRAA